MIALLAGCAGDPPPTDDPPESASPESTELPSPSSPCPDLVPGEVVFDVQGAPRRVLLAFPEDRPADLPVLVVWHGLGQSPERMFDQMALAAFAEDQRMVTVAPGSAVTAGPTWDIWATDGGADAALYDDLRICLADQLAVDLDRFATAGFSFGAWWAVWLAENRGDTLSAVHLMSGGVHDETVPWKTPSWPVPFLVSWGGPDDVYDDDVGHHFVFADTSADLAAAATADGHPVVLCEHDGGHAVPDDAVALNAAWFPLHRLGEPSPFAAEIGDLPPRCTSAR